MIEIDDKIVSTDVLTTCFSCDLSRCKGICCVEGSFGAPLSDDEVAILEDEYPNYRAYMKPEGVEAVERYGFAVPDCDSEYTTTLIDGAECAFSIEEGGVTLCAIERAWREGKTDFPKPISCHLYPIRVVKFGNGTLGLNYHRWGVCSSALECGKATATPMYKSLKAPIVRAFGEEFFDALGQAEEYVRNMDMK